MGDYLNHWIKVGQNLTQPPRIFHVNWFRKDTEGKFLWPGFGENVRALIWMLNRIRGEAGAKDAVFGAVPRPEDLMLDGLNISDANMKEVLRVTPQEWLDDLEEDAALFETFGSHMPAALCERFETLRQKVLAAGNATF
jgi:phosphoenolpyruvate carboxykinase (GTP)